MTENHNWFDSFYTFSSIFDLIIYAMASHEKMSEFNLMVVTTILIWKNVKKLNMGVNLF